MAQRVRRSRESWFPETIAGDQIPASKIVLDEEINIIRAIDLFIVLIDPQHPRKAAIYKKTREGAWRRITIIDTDEIDEFFEQYVDVAVLKEGIDF
ncbi:MAG: hypothetical protein Q6363_007760 [Candidatus Njordarchaeota archaeon]